MRFSINLLRKTLQASCYALFINCLATANPLPTINRSSVEPFLGTYCIECHGAEKQKGDLRLDTVEWVIKDNVTAQHWQDVLDVLNAGEMPPEDEKQPSEDTHSQIVGILTSNLSTARQQLSAKGGVNPIRKLNKREYLNTVKYLFGLNVHQSFIPDDIRGEDFDTNGADQYLDGPLLNQYLEIATQIVKEGFEWSGKPYDKVKTKRTKVKDLYVSRYLKAGDYDLKKPRADEGFYLYAGHPRSRDVTMTLGDDPRASYKIKIRAGLTDNKNPTRQFITYSRHSSVNGQRTPKLGVININGTLNNPSISEVTIPRTTLSTTTLPKIKFSEVTPYEITNGIRWYPIYLNMIGDDKKPKIWVNYLELEGPFYDSEGSVFGTLISKEGKNLGQPSKARELITAFSYVAFRRVKSDPTYVDKLVSYFQARMSEGLDYEDAMSQTLALVMISPGFIYLEEPIAKPGSKSRVLEARAFAIRLAYFLWSAPPDTELYLLGDSGEILKPDVLKSQINRMLDDPKAESFYHGFMQQWIEVDRFLDITVDWKENLRNNDGVRASAAREPIEYFKTLVKENLTVDRFIDSPFVVVDAILAKYYDLPGTHDFQGFKKISIPASHPRGGLITQPAFLTMGSNGERPSPVIRGTMILEKILNNPPPSPPPNVPELESATDKPISNRELVELHRSQKVCASCHDKIDPIGFGLENFDTVGLWQDTEVVGKKKIKINPGGTLISGVKFHDLKGLQILLKSQEHKLAENVIETLTSYAIGRPIEFSDETNIQKVLKESKFNKYRLKDMIFEVANSKTFRSK